MQSLKMRCMVDGFPDSSVGKESACNAGDPGSIPGLERSPGEGIGYPLQYFGLESSMDCIVHGAAKSWTRLSDFHSLTHGRQCVLCMLVTQSCPALCDPMDYSLPGSSIHGTLQARILQWVAISFSNGRE